jgi:hypothetical protein
MAAALQGRCTPYHTHTCMLLPSPSPPVICERLHQRAGRRAPGLAHLQVSSVLARRRQACGVHSGQTRALRHGVCTCTKAWSWTHSLTSTSSSSASSAPPSSSIASLRGRDKTRGHCCVGARMQHQRHRQAGRKLTLSAWTWPCLGTARRAWTHPQQTPGRRHTSVCVCRRDGSKAATHMQRAQLGRCRPVQQHLQIVGRRHLAPVAAQGG